MNTTRTPASADPNVTKLFQKHISALFAILSNDLSSRIYDPVIMDILPFGMRYPMALLCYSVQHGWFFHGKHDMVPEAV